MEVTNILQTRPYELNDEEKVPVMKSWLGREGLQLIQTHTSSEKEACIKFSCIPSKCFDNNNEVNHALLQIRSMPIGVGPPSPTTLLLNRPFRVLLSQNNREPINFSADNENYEALKS